MKPTNEMIEAGRMVLVDTTGHGYGPKLVRAVYDAMRGSEADIRADERERLAKLASDRSMTCDADIGVEGATVIDGPNDLASWLRSQGGEDE
jgi:hypothetical protein